MHLHEIALLAFIATMPIEALLVNSSSGKYAHLSLSIHVYSLLKILWDLRLTKLQICVSQSCRLDFRQRANRFLEAYMLAGHHTFRSRVSWLRWEWNAYSQPQAENQSDTGLDFVFFGNVVAVMACLGRGLRLTPKYMVITCLQMSMWVWKQFANGFWN